PPHDNTFTACVSDKYMVDYLSVEAFLQLQQQVWVELPQTSVPNPDEATSKEMQDEEPDLEDASKQERDETEDDENLDMNAGFGDNVIETGADLSLNDDKCTDDIVMEEVSVGCEISSAVKEQVNIASATLELVLLHHIHFTFPICTDL
ncbi:hypothetical protein Tco_1140959, partial [Tanacetum coccineum]